MRLKSEKGQAMVEFALVLPILLLLLGGIIDFGWIFGNQLLADNAVREAARYTAVHYYDSTSDDDTLAAHDIVTDRAPTLVNPYVSISVQDEKVTVSVSSQVTVLTPILSAVFPDGTYTVQAQCIMRLE